MTALNGLQFPVQSSDNRINYSWWSDIQATLSTSNNISVGRVFSIAVGVARKIRETVVEAFSLSSHLSIDIEYILFLSRFPSLWLSFHSSCQEPHKKNLKKNLEESKILYQFLIDLYWF